MQDRTHFGFKTVETEEKASLVRGVFDSVAPKYDIMNDLMSSGLHRLWKNDMVSWLNPTPSMHILDVAGGTADIALRILDKAACKVTVLDINKEMLDGGRNNAIDHNRLDIEFICADAEKLPLPDSTYDAYTIAFGIRNVTHIENALKEAYRVLKPGGRFLCLEFSSVKNDVLRKIYDAYSFHVIPQIGKMVTGDKEAYQYLVESIRKFPKQEEFAQMMRDAGFGNVQYRNMTHGVVALHSGRRL